ncbi:MAG: 1-acyl-sn-glycerol-3-phosphate acyltransferase [Prevotella sp.]|nr:1-acyl-sn-glycerol-3-phosphate acyltransferase [Prevotella sp.]
MTIPEAFDSIRPFEPEELPQAYDRLLADKQFVEVLAFLYPGVPAEAIAAKMRQCRTNLEFQKTFCYTFLEQLLLKVAKGCDMDTSQVDVTKRYTFVSNHRDIVLDSALLDKLLIDAGFTTTCEIAIGDNLLSLPWVRDLVRVNKAFIVERSLPPRQMLLASKRLAEYMHFAIAQKNENVWIAQREGRAKDSDDRTQPAILKMMAMGGEGSPAERLKQLHIVPLAISYEYDPCDFLKAKELQQRRDTTDFHKAPGDDVRSMQTGILGYKGRIHYHCAPCIDQFLDTVADMPKGELFDKVAAYIDQEIHLNYRLYPANFIALDMLEGSNAHEDRYSKEDKAFFDKYFQGQLAKIDLEKPDHQFLRERMLTMYANPARNQLILSAK